MNRSGEIDPDPSLSASERALVQALTLPQVRSIDEALLRASDDRWRKVANVIGSAIESSELPGIPDLFFAERIRALVARGDLVSSGPMDRMRYCEVRKSSGVLT